MHARVTSRDESGKPLTIEIEDGFMLSHGPYNPEEHGWIETQIDDSAFPMIRAGQQLEQLLDEVNALRRENWRLKQQLKAWIGAAGFGGR